MRTSESLCRSAAGSRVLSADKAFPKALQPQARSNEQSSAMLLGRCPSSRIRQEWKLSWSVSATPRGARHQTQRQNSPENRSKPSANVEGVIIQVFTARAAQAQILSLQCSGIDANIQRFAPPA